MRFTAFENKYLDKYFGLSNQVLDGCRLDRCSLADCKVRDRIRASEAPDEYLEKALAIALEALEKGKLNLEQEVTADLISPFVKKWELKPIPRCKQKQTMQCCS